MAYRCLKDKDNFGSPIDTRIPYRIINRPFGEEVCLVDASIVNYKADDIHPVIFRYLQDWDTGENITSLQQLVHENPSGKVGASKVETVSKKEQSQKTVEIVIEGQEYDFYVSKDSKTAYLVQCEELSIEAIAENKSGKWTVKGKGAKKYREEILKSAQGMK